MQEVIYMEDGANLKFTTGKWLTPDGNWINEKGISPDVKVDYPDYASLPYIDPNQTYELGTEHVVVETAKRILEVLGYDPGEVNTVFDETTEAALKAYQEENELEITGILTGDTTYALMDAISEKLKTEDPQILKAKELLGVTPEATTD